MEYVIDPFVDEPVMLINRDIGQGEGQINGAEFQKELMQLDSMNPKRIIVKINSSGGSVMDGYNIYDAILKTKTPVDTYNYGIAASIAGAIFMAGRKRYMADYAKMMMHPVSGAGDTKAYEAIMDSIAGMLSEKSNCSKDEITSMMSATSWLSSSECLNKGLCTSIEATKEANKKYAPANGMELWAYSNNLLLNQNKTKMENVTNLLNLSKDASEASIEGAIKSLQDAKNTLEQTKTDLENQLQAAKDSVSDLETKLNDANAELEVANKEKQDAIELEATNKATQLIDTYSNRIGTDESIKAEWVNLAKNNFEQTEAMLKAIPLNLKAENIDEPKSQTKQTAASLMAEIANKNTNIK